MTYALLDENGYIINAIILDEWRADEFPNAVPVGDIQANIGDKYENGIFYHDGEPCYSRIEELERALQIIFTGVGMDE